MDQAIKAHIAKIVDRTASARDMAAYHNLVADRSRMMMSWPKRRARDL